MEEDKRKEILQQKINKMSEEQNHLNIKISQSQDSRKSTEFESKIKVLEEMKKFMKVEQEEKNLKGGNHLDEEGYSNFIENQIKLKMEELVIEEEILKERKKNVEQRLLQKDFPNSDDETLEEKKLKFLEEERKTHQEQRREEEQILNEIAIQEKKESNRLIEIEKRLQFIEIEVRLLEQDQSQGAKNAIEQFQKEYDDLKIELTQVRSKLDLLTEKNKFMHEKFEKSEKERKNRIQETTMKSLEEKTL